eukprot:TRINITY_DN10696_c0_g1_i2.p1 TRINITY_DN10696_c0_g1~~TRINITY_DN10696_c0_g1_i2.p1  ORF type:complete len:279 (-),score=50.28 TRINITY_DN10696_c0_g1_i2:185-1021(-)
MGSSNIPMSCASFLKCWIYTSIALLLVMGIVVEIVFVVLACGRFAEAAENKTSLIVTGTICLCVMILVAIIGCCGASKKNTCLLITYAIIAGLLCACFWISFVYMKKGKDNIHDDVNAICANNNKNTFINDLNNVYRNNVAAFCTAACPCKADANKFTGAAYATMVRNANGATVIANCPNNPVSGVKNSLLSFLGWLEEKKDCSGICTQQPYYYFSDVNRGVPGKACKDPLLDYLDKWYIGAYVVTIIAGVVTFLGTISSLLYICLGTKKTDEKSAAA